MKSMLYIYDPLCGWCYAAAPAISRLLQAGVSVKLQPSGLFSTAGRVLTADFAAHAWQNDQRIAALTGQTFSEAYRHKVLQAVGAPFDSSPATLALTAVAVDQPAREVDTLRALQEGRYVFGRDITDVAVVSAILVETGLAEAASAFEENFSTLRAANARRVAAGQAVMREFGASGVPTVVISDGTIRTLFDNKLLCGPASSLSARISELSGLELQGEAG